MDAAEVIAATSPTFASHGSAWYFTPETVAAGREVGLDGMRFYLYGRGGVLGDVPWQVVAAAFGYFHPAVVQRLWTTSQERCDRATAVAAHLGACAAWGRERYAGVDGTEAFCEAAEALVAAAAGDLGGLTLFAGYAAQPLPDDAPARAAVLVATLRELRGSAHLAAVVASGLPTQVAHAIRRPGDVETFGWRGDDAPRPTDDDRRRLADADRMTDEVLLRAFGQLPGASLDALAAWARAVA